MAVIGDCDKEAVIADLITVVVVSLLHNFVSLFIFFSEGERW